MRRLAVASLVAQVALIVTGGAVRLTSSGLGCPRWPRCSTSSYVTHREYGVHGAIEFGNRMLTFVLVVVAVVTLVAAVRERPRRRDHRLLAAALLLGIPVQAVVGGISVLTHLNPWVVGLHFLASSALVATATVLVRRTADAGGRGQLLVPPALVLLGRVQLGVLAVVLVLGTVVTGSGPHAGDRASRRTGLDPEAVSQLHADLVFLLVGITAAGLLALRAAGAPSPVAHGAAVLLAVELGQGTIGFVQYFTGLPGVLVAAHLLGAALLVVAAVRAYDLLRARPDGAAPPARVAAARRERAAVPSS